VPKRCPPTPFYYQKENSNAFEFTARGSIRKDAGRLFDRNKIAHTVLSAENHEFFSEIGDNILYRIAH
jgi:hypothetical protein